MPAPFAYDVVDYPSLALPQAHPGHLCAVARMFGCDPAPVENCRVLEVGCGDGLHLIACAIGMPRATFVGLDLSTEAVARGHRLIGDLGLTNIALLAADVTTWSPPDEPFDYAFAHGFYSWVPPFVRDAVLKLFATALAPTGIGYLSYNTYPGCYVRRMLWEMIKFHTAGIDDPAAKIGQAREFAKFLGAGAQGEQSDAAFGYMKREVEEILGNQDPRVLYHDDLGPINDPVYFRDFAAHAGEFGLRFVAEAEQFTMEPRGFPPEIEGILNGLLEKGAVLKEQYIDFLRVRRFRETLLAPDGRAPSARPDPKRIGALAASGQPKPDDQSPDLSHGVAAVFRSGKALVRTDLAIGKAALVALAECWPERVPFGELVRRSAAKLGLSPAAPHDAEQLAELLTAAWMTGIIKLHGHVPVCVDTVGERPRACPLARAQARAGPWVTSRYLKTMQFEDVPSRKMIESLDGTWDLDGVLAEMRESFPPGHQPDAATLRAGVEKNLLRLAKSGLLVG